MSRLVPYTYIPEGDDAADRLQTQPGRNPAPERIAATLARGEPTMYLPGQLEDGPQAAAHSRHRRRQVESIAVVDPRQVRIRYVDA